MRAKWVLGVAIVMALGAVTLASAQQRPDGQPGGRGPGPGGPGGFGGRGGGMFFGGRGGGGASRMMLLSIAEIRKELELADEQVAEIEKLQEELRAKYPNPFGGRGGPGGPGGPGGEGDRGRRGRGPGGNQGTFNAPTEWYFVQAQDPNQQGQGRRGGFNFGQPPSAEDRARFEQQQLERAREEKARLADILLPEQLKRLNEIFVQVAGVGALQDEEIAAELGISESQKTKISEVRQQNREAFGAIMRDGGGDPEANRAKMEELTKANDAKLLAVLSGDQQKKFEAMKGKSFQMPEGFGRGGPGGPGGPGGFRGRGNRGGNNN